MKTIKQLLITVAVLLYSATASAYKFEVDGIYYEIRTSSDLTVAVTSGDNKYTGNIVIPTTVVHKSKVREVIGIRDDARYSTIIELVGTKVCEPLLEEVLNATQE